MELIILLSLMTALASSASLDAELCWEGESFWCQSLANAKTCRAVDHCKETVWKNMNLEECKELIGEEARLQIGDSELALRKMCCSLGICNRDAILEPRENLHLETKQIKLDLSKASPTEKCRVCQKFFSSLQTRLKTSDTQASLLNVLRVEICPLLPAVNTDMCMSALESTLPLILELSLQFYDHKMICHQLTMCPLAEEDHLAQYDVDWNMLQLFLNEDQKKTVNCTICEAVFDFIGKLNLSVGAVIEKTLLIYFCQEICPFQMLCKGVVQLLVSQIANNVVNWLYTERFHFCKVLNFCVDSKNSASRSLHQQQQQRLGFRKPNVCQLCLQVLKTVIGSEAVNKTEMTFLNAMRMACDSLWWPYGSHCHRMVDAVGRQTLEKFSQRLHPEGVCEMLGFCDGASDIDIIRNIVETVASERCSYCQSTAGYLSVLLGQERAVNEIQSQMKRICEFRPFGMVDKEECESVVDKYTPMFVDYLSEDLSKDNVCQRASLCTGLTSNDGSGITMAAMPPAILELWPQFKCLYGSQFWCATVDNAKLCQMEQYCGRESK